MMIPPAHIDREPWTLPFPSDEERDGRPEWISSHRQVVLQKKLLTASDFMADGEGAATNVKIRRKVGRP